MNAKAKLINALIEANENEEISYIEIGYDRGDTFGKVKGAKKVAIDPAGGASHVIATTSDDYFSNLAGKVDYVFIDGDHRAQQVEKDVVNAYKKLRKGGALILHDCNPHNEGMQAVPRQQRIWTGDVWKVCYGFINQYGDKIKYEYNDSDPYGLFIIYKTGNYRVKEGFTDFDLPYSNYKGYE